MDSDGCSLVAVWGCHFHQVLTLQATMSISTDHLDSGSDSLSLARTAVLESAQRLNLLDDMSGAGTPVSASRARLRRLRTDDGRVNFTGGNLSRWAAAAARVRAKVGHARMALIGDSETAGVGSNPSASNGDIRRNSMPAVVARTMSDVFGVPSRITSFWGDGWEGSNAAVADPRLSIGSGWVPFMTMVPGGWAWRDGGTAQTPLSFAAGESDTLDLYCIAYPGYANVVISSGGTFHGGGPTSATAGIVKFTATRTVSSAPWEVRKYYGSTTDLIVIGADAYVNGVPSLHVLNMGAAGSKVMDWALPNQPWNAKNALSAMDIDLFGIGLTVNDWYAATAKSDYQAALATLIEAFLARGDVFLYSGAPSNVGTAPVERQLLVTEWMIEMAMQYNIPALVLSDRWVSQALYPMRGLYFDGLHPSLVGYDDWGYWMTSSLMRA